MTVSPGPGGTVFSQTKRNTPSSATASLKIERAAGCVARGMLRLRRKLEPSRPRPNRFAPPRLPADRECCGGLVRRHVSRGNPDRLLVAAARTVTRSAVGVLEARAPGMPHADSAPEAGRPGDPAIAERFLRHHSAVASDHPGRVLVSCRPPDRRGVEGVGDQGRDAGRERRGNLPRGRPRRRDRKRRGGPFLRASAGDCRALPMPSRHG